LLRKATLKILCANSDGARFVSGMGFFTDAYDLFTIGLAQ
jgi:hypothetical protein